MAERIKVLNIIGCGRSGSTILGNTLGQARGWEHVGELCYIWNRGIVLNALCGCGQPFRECGFWRRVLERSELPVDEGTAARLSAFPRRANRRMAWTLLRGGGPLDLADGIEEYVDALGSLYRAIHAETASQVIVDSTKAPSHSWLLRAVADVDLYVLHLVRDARAVAYSWGRVVRRVDQDPRNPALMDRFTAFRSGVKWAYANLVVELLRDRLGERMLTVRYEDFLADPPGTVERIMRLTGGTRDPVPFVSDRELHLDATHTVWGNPGRLRTGLTQLRLDAEWEKKMTMPRRAVVRAVSWPLLRKYAYVGRARPSGGKASGQLAASG